MVDFLRIFRRKGPGRGRQGFARSRQEGLRGDITSLAARMGDIFRPAAGEKPLPAPRDAAPVRREPVAATVSREPPPLAPNDSAFMHDAPPIPRNLPREAAKEQPRTRAPANGTAPRKPQAGYLAIHGVEKSFGTRKIVHGVSLYVRRGEAVGILGPNGAGKTTCFYMITGLIKPDAGRVELDGHDVTQLPMYQRARLGIGYLPQEASIFRGLSVEDNIRAVLEVVEPDKRKRERELDSLLEEFNVTRLRKSPSIALSGGERRRVEIARALASRPSYMLLD